MGVWDAGMEGEKEGGGGGGGAGCARVIHVGGSAPRLQPLHTLRERKAAFLCLPNSSKRLRGCSVTTITAVYPQKRFQEADVSMTFPGKLPSVLLLVLLAAQGKHSGPPPFFARHEPVASPKRSELPSPSLWRPLLIYMACALLFITLLPSCPRLKPLSGTDDRFKRAATNRFKTAGGMRHSDESNQLY